VNHRKTFAVAALAALALSLGACVSLFPKAEPVQLYTFHGAVVAATAASAPPTVAVMRAPTSFPRAASSDRILTRNGAENAYLAGARWSAPASVLFDETLAAAFDTGTVRLATRGEPGPSDAVLRVEVRTFEAEYRDGAEAAPTAVVDARATLISLRDRSVLGTRTFHAEHKADDNRAAPIVEAYDAALGDLMTQLVGWTTETVKPANAP
jgi:cholesterol transport system auxiliary component